MIVFQFNKPLDPSKYTYDESNGVFCSDEDNLVIDFSDFDCSFVRVGSNCKIAVGDCCIIHGDDRCIITSGGYCTFILGSESIFRTGDFCKFDVEQDCDFHTGHDCVFNVRCGGSFKTGKQCIIKRKDIFEVIQLMKEENIIRVNGYEIPGYVVEETKEEILEKLFIKLNNMSKEELNLILNQKLPQ